MGNPVRSLRLEEDLLPRVDSLPPRSTNALVNNLLRLFFDDEFVRAKVIELDPRFGMLETGQLSPLPPQPVEKPRPAPSNLLDSILPK